MLCQSGPASGESKASGVRCKQVASSKMCGALQARTLAKVAGREPILGGSWDLVTAYDSACTLLRTKVTHIGPVRWIVNWVRSSALSSWTKSHKPPSTTLERDLLEVKQEIPQALKPPIQ